MFLLETSYVRQSKSLTDLPLFWHTRSNPKFRWSTRTSTTTPWKLRKKYDTSSSTEIHNMLKPKFVLITNVCTDTLTILYGIFYIHISKGKKIVLDWGRECRGTVKRGTKRTKKKKGQIRSIFFGPNRKQRTNTGNVVFVRSGEGQHLVGVSRCWFLDFRTREK